MLDFLGGLVLGAIAGANIAFFSFAILIASKDEKREKQLKAEVKLLTARLKSARADTLTGLLERLKSMLHEAEMHGNFEPVLTAQMLEDAIDEILSGDVRPTPDEKGCTNCKHEDVHANDAPCVLCQDSPLDKWEPKTKGRWLR